MVAKTSQDFRPWRHPANTVNTDGRWTMNHAGDLILLPPSSINPSSLEDWARCRLAAEKALDAVPNLFLAHARQTERLGEAAIIGAWFVGASLAIQPLRRRMQWRKPFRQLRPEQSQRWHATKRRQMPRPGIVADKSS